MDKYSLNVDIYAGLLGPLQKFTTLALANLNQTCMVSREGFCSRHLPSERCKALGRASQTLSLSAISSYSRGAFVAKSPDICYAGKNWQIEARREWTHLDDDSGLTIHEKFVLMIEEVHFDVRDVFFLRETHFALLARLHESD